MWYTFHLYFMLCDLDDYAFSSHLSSIFALLLFWTSTASDAYSFHMFKKLVSNIWANPWAYLCWCWWAYLRGEGRNFTVENRISNIDETAKFLICHPPRFSSHPELDFQSPPPTTTTTTPLLFGNQEYFTKMSKKIKLLRLDWNVSVTCGWMWANVLIRV